MPEHRCNVRRERGLTLIDLLLVLIIASFVGAYAVMRINSAGENTLWFQAQKMGRDIRHLQVLTSTYGKSLQMSASGSGYSVACVSPLPCDSTSTYLLDPVTGDSFNVALQNGVALTVSGTNPVSFDNQGRPLSSGAITTGTTTFTLSVGGTTATVAVAPITGFVTVTP